MFQNPTLYSSIPIIINVVFLLSDLFAVTGIVLRYYIRCDNTISGVEVSTAAPALAGAPPRQDPVPRLPRHLHPPPPADPVVQGDPGLGHHPCHRAGVLTLDSHPQILHEVTPSFYHHLLANSFIDLIFDLNIHCS